MKKNQVFKTSLNNKKLEKVQTCVNFSLYIVAFGWKLQRYSIYWIFYAIESDFIDLEVKLKVKRGKLDDISAKRWYKSSLQVWGTNESWK